MVDWSRKIFWTSDPHHSHGNVIRYCDRPFAVKHHRATEWFRPSELLGKPVSEVSYEVLKRDVLVDAVQMNRVLTERWNSVVGPQDIVFHLGDHSFGKKPEMAASIKKLNGYKILVKGNHDRGAEAMLEAGFDEVHTEYMIEVPGTGDHVFMRHYPTDKQMWAYKAKYHFCGHVHEKWRRYGNMINVGVDQWDFTPRSFDELIAAPKQGIWPKPEEMD